ncbi:metal-sensing transcriptional repressor [Brevirhabdus sp.]|uniref:metal-sensing transcriptional repressor n=1 Tax=Brevirhabdus sp. TaxID=2004514 RepID=UPI0040590AE8
MSQTKQHTTHPDLIKRLKRAEGHLRHVIGMLEDERPCADIATQMQAVERAITAAKRTLIHDHIDHCLGSGTDASSQAAARDLAELRLLAKLL